MMSDLQMKPTVDKGQVRRAYDVGGSTKLPCDEALRWAKVFS